MKKIISSLAILSLTSVTSLAQQAIWGEMKLKSPEWNPDDSTITFRFEAPNAKEVIITGDFNGYQQVPLTQNVNGIWTVTLDPLESDMYGYKFIVDGLEVLDPNNAYVVRDTNTLENILIAPGNKADLYNVGDVPHGTVSHVWYYSPSLDTDRRLTVYTPAEYSNNTDKRYPVLYLLHGLGGDENAWAEKGRMPQILDNMIANGSVEPMIVVLTNGNSPQQAAPGENPDGLFVQPTTKLAFESGAFESSFPDVVEFIDNNYRTKAQKDSRAIAGLSMGGMHTRAISMNYPDLFDYVGLFSAAINPIFNGETPIYENVPEKLRNQFEVAPKMYWIGIGKEDFLMNANIENRELMDSLGLPYQYHESAGGHTWSNWRDYLVMILPNLFKQ